MSSSNRRDTKINIFLLLTIPPVTISAKHLHPCSPCPSACPHTCPSIRPREQDRRTTHRSTAYFHHSHFLSFTLTSAVLCINHTLFCTYQCKFTPFPFIFKNIFLKKLAKGWGDVLSLHLQTGLCTAFHSVFHALLRHCIPYISPKTFPLFARYFGEERCKDNIPLP